MSLASERHHDLADARAEEDAERMEAAWENGEVEKKNYLVSGGGFAEVVNAATETCAISKFINTLASDGVSQDELESIAWEAKLDGSSCLCEGAGYLLTAKGGRVICPICGGIGDDDRGDPQCVCGVYRSEHAMLGCTEGFQTKGSWAVEREFIASLDDDVYERIYHPEG